MGDTKTAAAQRREALKDPVTKQADKDAGTATRTPDAPGQPHRVASHMSANTPGPLVDPKLQVQVDQYTKRSDDDALYGHFCRIVKGDHEGTVGVYAATLDREDDGWPKTIIVEPVGQANTMFQVPYKDVRHTDRAPF